MKNEINKTAHSTYRCEYHIVFAPKYRRQIVYGQIKKDIGEIFRKLCNEKRVEIIEAEACPNHMHIGEFQAVKYSEWQKMHNTKIQANSDFENKRNDEYNAISFMFFTASL